MSRLISNNEEYLELLFRMLKRTSTVKGEDTSGTI